MYLEQVLLLNSGPVERASFRLPFHPDGRPKPVVIVGGNGAGKTNFLSTVADTLMELAAKHYGDVLEPLGAGGHRFFRISGGRCQRVSAKYELSALRFRENQQAVHFLAQSGEVPFDEIAKDLEPFGGLNVAKRKKAKTGDMNAEVAEKVFREGVYVYFPSSRHEIPFWLNEKSLDSDPPAQMQARFAHTLAKPMVMERGISALKPWIIDLLLDASVEAGLVLEEGFKQAREGQSAFRQMLIERLRLSATLADLNRILQSILLRPDARVARRHRGAGERRLQIFYGSEVAMPTLDALSAGQGTLLNVFGSTLRFGTETKATATAADAEGIVLVDEIDAHLHADLQYVAVPKLMAMFPKVQFIVTCHSPLLPLGMEKQFGVDSYQIIEMPAGSPINAERYGEFQRSFDLFQATKAFEETLQRVAAEGRPLVIGEGQTDPTYLTAAAKLLGFDDVLQQVDFTWIGDLDSSGKRTGGQGELKKAVEIYRKTLPLLGRSVLCLFDQKSAEDVKATPFTNGKLAVRTLPLIPDHPHCNDGSENLLPPELFTENFYVTEEKLRGTKRTFVRDLRKVQFADHVCKLGDPKHFENFRVVLEEIRAALVTKSANDTGDATDGEAAS